MPAGPGPDWLRPRWAAPANVHLIVTTRSGGRSAPPREGFNLALHVGDDSRSVIANRRYLQQELDLPRQPAWLEQVHGTVVVDAAGVDPSAPAPVADAAFTREAGVACVVMTADCLPVAIAARDGSVVGVAHAGWKGLCQGVIESLVGAMAGAMAVPGGELVAWLGPAVGPAAYETGAEVREAFVARDPAAAAAFVPVLRADGTPGFLSDLYSLARLRLRSAGIGQVEGGGFCTFTDNARFYSYRRQPVTGRFATLVWRT